MVGSLAVMVSVSAGTLLIVDFVFGPRLAWGTAVAVLCLVSWAWLIQPALHRRRKSA